MLLNSIESSGGSGELRLCFSLFYLLDYVNVPLSTTAVIFELIPPFAALSLCV